MGTLRSQSAKVGAPLCPRCECQRMGYQLPSSARSILSAYHALEPLPIWVPQTHGQWPRHYVLPLRGGFMDALVIACCLDGGSIHRLDPQEMPNLHVEPGDALLFVRTFRVSYT